ncbi:hypothetical protein SLEP1_g41974 [Rubroshorea leprosula]|uniref:Uncharacterized protein n=1 Tax=Rubroshorea leprosula TaxID=152421 RepID=A0AAV5L8V2_9ROSI|nr:hypothetical protein SLEP1_g41974 [Rubroshorea leprosula]
MITIGSILVAQTSRAQLLPLLPARVVYYHDYVLWSNLLDFNSYMKRNCPCL